MFVHEICGSWMDHPFWKTSFMLESHKDLLTLQKSNIREVWIDPAKGRDVSQVNASHQNLAESSEVLVEMEAEEISSTPSVPRKATFFDELDRARRIHVRSRGVVNSLLAECRMGLPPNLEEAEGLVEEISNSVLRNSDALVSLLHHKPRSSYPYLHAVSVSALMVALAKQMDFDASMLRRAGLAGLLLDAGMALIPPEIVHKQGQLTDEEFATIKTHALLGRDLLFRSGVTDELVLDVCLHHHERADGLGYPDQLHGEMISVHAAMGAICDVYDAVTSERTYHKGWAPNYAIRKMADWQKGQFDRTAFHAFVRSVGLYPSGTLVRLKSGRLGTVIEQNDRSLLSPVVKVIFSIKQNARIEPVLVDLGKTDDSILGAEDPKKWALEDMAV
ncbi:MAG: HD-GYP domain-containing protein [Ferrovum sp.]|nr:HD-GYP domain-containing protein [Ferrovum sp.]NDU88098.1 HD-GYP domain-containing protein [Ferrovum sp.]